MAHLFHRFVVEVSDEQNCICLIVFQDVFYPFMSAWPHLSICECLESTKKSIFIIYLRLILLKISESIIKILCHNSVTKIINIMKQ